jgi:hypothetical protein
MTAATEIAKILESLTPMQTLYVQARLEGMTQVAAATAAGAANPKKNASQFEKSENVRQALRQSKQIFAEKLQFDRKKAHEMYMDAYRAADTATEQKLVVDSLVKLHGIAAPEVKKLEHTHKGEITHKKQLSHMPDSKLLEMANLTPAEDPDIIDGEFVELDGKNNQTTDERAEGRAQKEGKEAIPAPQGQD